MKILITGGCGFVGSNLAIFLKKNLANARISTLDNLCRKGSLLNKKRLSLHKIKNFRLNIENLSRIMKLPKFDLVIDCCAEPAIENSSKEPERVFNTNLIGTFNILKKLSKDKSKIIFLSSSRVYAITKLRKLCGKFNYKKKIKIKNEINENFSTKGPKSLYGFTKLASEELLREFSYLHNVKYIINRFGVIAGPWQFGKKNQGFFTLWIARHLNKKNLKYIGFGGYGNQVRDIIHINDVCEIILRQIKKINSIYGETFNIGGGKNNSISLKELTNKCELISGNKIKFKKIRKTSIFDIPYYVTDNSKIFKYFKWKPRNNIENILTDIFLWIKNNKSIRGYFKKI